MEKKKVKKKSLSSQLRKAKERINECEELLRKRWDERMKAIESIRILELILPKKWYRIRFKMKGKDEKIHECQDILWSYSVEMVIAKLKNNKIYPESLELLDINLLGE